MSHIVWRGVLSTCAGGPRWERSGGFVAHMMVSHVVIWNLAAAALTSLCCSDGSDVPSQLWFGFIQLCVLGAAARSGGFCSALERHRVCGAAIALRLCPSVCVCVNYCHHPGDSGGRRVRHLEENTHGGHLDEPPDRASTWNSAACYYGNRKSGW